MEPRRLAPNLWISGQVQPEELPALAARLGLKRVINNRPDGEEPGQPAGAAVRAAAERAGLDYVAAPVRGMPDAAAMEAVSAALVDGAPALLFCRSGMRSAAAWALAARARGEDPAMLREQAAAAGYDLGPLPL